MKPTLKESPDLTTLKELVQMHIDSIANGTYHEDDDDAHYMYEELMVSFVNEDFFYWKNKFD
jgi:putative N-acetylmannosamine-6-phosphate epimerase